MTYDYTVKQDGQTYPPGTDVPDMGSIRTCDSIYHEVLQDGDWTGVR